MQIFTISSDLSERLWTPDLAIDRGLRHAHIVRPAAVLPHVGIVDRRRGFAWAGHGYLILVLVVMMNRITTQAEDWRNPAWAMTALPEPGRRTRPGALGGKMTRQRA